MGTKSLFSMAACCAFAIGTAAAQESSPSSLDATLYRSVCERVQAPMVFSTRDTLFALSLPTDEPARVYLQLTVGKNGKIKEKETRVHANHIAGYVAPAFVAAAKDLRVDRSLLGDLTGKDTSLLLTFPLEYQCVYDTINKVQPSIKTIIRQPSLINYRSTIYGSGETALQKDVNKSGVIYTSYDPWDIYYSKPTRVWYYLAFIKDQPE